ncbi:hypothetical protein Rhe02_95380 [Rhizocola hellebori]|uniref:Uncharacterized protein n=1 Tax=Rhizocola hellebori TaxID=1392758 RepID=A0A8J3VMM4_9ACTN|nr:hypothetical protein [Rhizocola hellebori]GIH11471.1 hypothetical protein Rhe02_95380 [Rhizocola hellebori]
MNKWLYRAVGVASGALLLSGGVAHAEAASEAKPTVDPQAMRGLLADLFTPTGGQHYLGLSIDTESASGQREELLPGLGLIGGAAGNGGLLGGLTGGSGSSGLVGSLTGGLTGGSGGSGLLGGLTGGLTGGGGPLGGLTGGLTGGDGPLGGLTGGLTGGDGPLGGLTSGLAGTPLGAPLSGLTSGLAGNSAADDDVLPGLDIAALQDLAAANGGVLGTDGPASTDIVDPALIGTDLDTTNQRPVILDPAIARQVNDATGPMVSALIADAAAQKAMTGEPNGVQTESIEEGLPLVSDVPVVGTLVGPGGPLSQFLVVGSLFDNLPVVGDLTKGGGVDLGTIDRLPLVGKMLNTGIIQADGPSLPVVGGLPLIGKALDGITAPLNKLGQGDALGGLTKGPLNSLTQGPLGGLTQGGLGDPLGGLTQGPLGSLTQGPLGSLTQGPLGGLTQSPAATLPAPVAVPAQAQARPVAQRPAKATPTTTVAGQARVAAQVSPAGQAGVSGQAGQAAHVGKHRAPTATARPVVADPEYRDVEALPLIGDLTGGGGMGNLPVSTLVRQLPLVSELPLMGSLDTPLSLVKALPVIGMLAGLVPVESA